jgi:hypothetical protein
MTPTMTEKRPTGDTIGQYWQTLEADEARRDFLMRQLGMTVRVQGRGVARVRLSRCRLWPSSGRT